LTLACGCTLRALRSKSCTKSSDFVAGLTWGLTILTRPQILPVAPIAWLLVPFSSGVTLRRNVAHLVAQTCTVMIVVTPWILRNTVVMGKPTLSTVGAYTFWGAHNEIVLRNRQLWGSWVRTSDLVDEEHPVAGNELEREAIVWRYGL